jgi:hypothetical protein
VGSDVTITGSFDTGCNAWVEIREPDGDVMWYGQECMDGGGFIDALVLPVAGIYTLVVDPRTTATGGMTLVMFDLVDATGTVTIGGGGTAVTVTMPGQRAVLTMDGTQGQQVTVRLSGNTMGYTIVRLYRPNGTVQTSSGSSSSAFPLPTVTLSTTGVHTIVVDPDATNTGGITVAVTNP